MGDSRAQPDRGADRGGADRSGAGADRTARFGHPKGLWVLAGTELWDRISFHGMQAMLVLYMAGELLKPGRIEKVVGFPQYRAAIEAVNRRTGYLGPSVHQLERWAAEAERLEARATGNLAREWPGSCGF